MEKQNLVGVVLIATGKYDRFLQPLINSMDKHFFKGEDIDIYLFSDRDYLVATSERMTMHRMEVPHLPFPYPTLYRYKWMSEFSEWLTAKNLYYMDVDMLFVGDVGEEILPNDSGLVATRHPGFFHGGWGDHGTPESSAAYLKPKLRQYYYAGGFQGGEREMYLSAARTLAFRIALDETKDIMAKWHDESHWNNYLKFCAFKELTPEYCMVEEMELRKRWGIENLTPRIVALKKDHNALRS